jgi:hypothetical protein
MSISFNINKDNFLLNDDDRNSSTAVLLLLFFFSTFHLNVLLTVHPSNTECLDLYLQPSCMASYRVVSLGNHFIFLSSNEETSGK